MEKQVCEKCGYSETKSKCKEKFGLVLCSVCARFAPNDKNQFEKYVDEKIDWKLLETFRKYGPSQSPGSSQKSGMLQTAEKGKVISRAPLGYGVVDGTLVQNSDASRVHSLFKTFLEKDYSLNSLAKNYGLSVNGLKKVLSNRTYLGEIKFSGRLIKGSHKSLVSPEIFYAVQRKLGEICKVR